MSSVASSHQSPDRFVYLVIHDLIPTYSMHFRDEMYSEPIQTVNSTVIGVYTSHRKAQTAAYRYFFNDLGYDDNGESENGGFFYHDDNGECGTWDEEVWVDCETLK